MSSLFKWMYRIISFALSVIGIGGISGDLDQWRGWMTELLPDTGFLYPILLLVGLLMFVIPFIVDCSKKGKEVIRHEITSEDAVKIEEIRARKLEGIMAYMPGYIIAGTVIAIFLIAFIYDLYVS